jgi:3-deoxy-D-manno-octulosonic acid kinase
MRSAGAQSLPASPLDATGFARFHTRQQTIYLRRDLLGEASRLLARIAHAEATGEGVGNRGGGFSIELGCASVFVRRCRRGGWMRLLNRDVYCGLRPRPLRELAMAVEAARRGVPVAEPLGALVEPLAPALYRGAVITRLLTGMTLWQFLQADDDSRVRAHVLELARRAIATMHRGGLWHADLNLNNLFVTRAGESFAVVILDLDKSRLYPDSVPAARRRQNLQRLTRSARKLDPAGKLLTPAALSILTGE